jgi:hypothetical protein
MVVKKWGQKTRLAAELGISQAMVTKLAKRGMPADDADAARRWRTAHLSGSRMRPDPGPSADTLLQRAQTLADLAAAALERHQLGLVANDLRLAMHLVPASHRGRLVQSFALWSALIGAHALAVLNAVRAEEPLQTSAATAERDDAMLDMGEVCYALACGEAHIT